MANEHPHEMERTFRLPLYGAHVSEAKSALATGRGSNHSTQSSQGSPTARKTIKLRAPKIAPNRQKSLAGR